MPQFHHDTYQYVAAAVKPFSFCRLACIPCFGRGLPHFIRHVHILVLVDVLTNPGYSTPLGHSDSLPRAQRQPPTRQKDQTSTTLVSVLGRRCVHYNSPCSSHVSPPITHTHTFPSFHQHPSSFHFFSSSRRKLSQVLPAVVLRRSRHGPRCPASARTGWTPGRTDKVSGTRSGCVDPKSRRSYGRAVPTG